MEGYHGPIWFRPAARSSGKIVSIRRLDFSLYLTEDSKLSKIILPKPQSPYWSRLCSIKAAGESHFCRLHEPLIGRTDS